MFSRSWARQPCRRARPQLAPHRRHARAPYGVAGAAQRPLSARRHGRRQQWRFPRRGGRGPGRAGKPAWYANRRRHGAPAHSGAFGRRGQLAGAGLTTFCRTRERSSLSKEIQGVCSWLTRARAQALLSSTSRVWMRISEFWYVLQNASMQRSSASSGVEAWLHARVDVD